MVMVMFMIMTTETVVYIFDVHYESMNILDVMKLGLRKSLAGQSWVPRHPLQRDHLFHCPSLPLPSSISIVTLLPSPQNTPHIDIITHLGPCFHME